ncbi:MAG TPA: 3-isopropylmalate dehydratase large subunit [Syntrophorhabdaceae bacterium]|nr:3-isopropylmalate dehydratase large subunit [Syntrophorhabdaceae bacterium]HOL05742.1 3-isopropylmalate dehydratase large subunit [Syntrophorhabdaceae bacterium]HOT41772.1 3-isopropylmalate dehydratase large subunit [Syntrophorhabdaceae bacterium]HPC67204.1 3-isopropylmalate dehydratase large subunit [Syntrophorhabdaceae bacterium]HPP42463.1 3-isopropylmalate dehydratase large subunit [Syntrophorhabdaceae bacterium]
MGMTITEKILAAHSGRDFVEPGEIIDADVDIVLANDITAPLSLEEFEKVGAEKVFDQDKVVFVLDHFTPNKDIISAENCKKIREFSKKHGIKHFYEGGRCGIEHALLPEQGIVVPGDVVIGADSHTCTYGALGAFATGMGSTDITYAMVTGKIWFKVPESIKFLCYGEWNRWVTGKDLILHIIGMIGVDGALYSAMEFDGEAISNLSMDSRMTIANMAIEAGAKNGIFRPDEKTMAYVEKRAKRPPRVFESDRDAQYKQVIEIDVSKLGLKVACPSLPSNVKDVEDLKDIEIDQVVIGSCTNGRLEDLKMAADILKGKKIAPWVRCIVIPATPDIYRDALKLGYIEIFADAGCIISPPTCGPCLGGHMGVLAKGERAVATTNRNFIGRMGHPESEVYLSGPAVAAASAIAGKIMHPEGF